MRIEIFTLVVQCLIDTSPRLLNLQISRNGFSIASGSLTITPNPNNLASVVIVPDNSAIVSSQMNLNITFRINNSLLVDSRIRIEIPSTILLTGTNPSCRLTSSISAAVLSSINCSLSSYVILIPNFLQSSLSSGATISISI